MHQKQKINLSSRLAARGTHLINRHLTNESFEPYFYAQNEGKAAEFLRVHFADAPDNLGERLATYYEVSEKLTGLGIERSKELLLGGLSDDEGYARAESRGIIAEWRWLQYEFKETPKPNQQTILDLLQAEIVLLRQHTDLILGLDAELSILRQFDELPTTAPDDATLEKLIAEGNEIILGSEVLKRMRPTTAGTFSDIPLALKRKLVHALLPHATFSLRVDESLSEREKQAIANNQQALMEYIGASDEPPMIALFTLGLESAPPAFFQSGQYIVLLAQIGFRYGRGGFISDLVHEALVRLFAFALQHFDKVRQGDYDDVIEGGSDKLVLLIYRNLGYSYEYLWETDQAVAMYKKLAQHAFAVGNHRSFQDGMIKLIDCLKKRLEPEKAITYLRAAIEEDAAFWGLSQPFTLSEVVRKTLELDLIDRVNEMDYDTPTKRALLSIVRTEEAKIMLEILMGVAEDRLTDDAIQRAQAMIGNFYEKDMGNFFDSEASPNDKARALLEPLGFSDLPVAQHETILQKVATLEHSLSPYYKLLYNLHRTKLLYLQKDLACLRGFTWHLSQLKHFNDQMSLLQQGYWHNQQLRAFSLTINDAEPPLAAIQSTVAAAVKLIAVGYLDEYRGQNAQTMAVSELENTIKALMRILETSERAEIDQALLQIVWNTLVFKQRYLNRFLGKGNISIPNERVYQEQLQQLKTDLATYYFSESFQTKVTSATVQKLVYGLRRMEYPVTRDEHFDLTTDKPQSRSVLFHFFTRFNDNRRVLVLSYMPKGHPLNEQPFNYRVYTDFEQVENYLDDFQFKAGIRWRREGILSVLSSREATELLTKKITPFLTKREDPIGSFISRLKGGAAAKKLPSINLFADSFLHQLPVESLPDKQGQSLRLSRDIHFVVKTPQSDSAIVYWEGITLFSEVPAFPNHPFLPYAGAETQQIEQLAQQANVPVRHFRGVDATVDNLKIVLRKRPSILHFAVHGILDKNLSPEAASLLLAATSDQPQTGLLTFRDILSLDLSSVRLVVLSGCRSGIGEIGKGAPVQSLAYAFLQAGARFVMASRIKVDDKKTALIMGKFYEYLFQAGDVGIAFQQTTQYFTNTDTVTPVDLAAWGIWC
ncbi:MAG: CHAT domain-containing protein [Bacteroidota bacterium]